MLDNHCQLLPHVQIFWTSPIQFGVLQFPSADIYIPKPGVLLESDSSRGQ